MARIMLLLTKTPWHDRRQFYRQGPSLVDHGHQVLYTAARPDEGTTHPFEWVELESRERKLARRTGGLNLFSRIRRLEPDLIQLCSVELLPLGLALKHLTSIRVVYDCREDIASALFERRKNLPLCARRLVFRSIRWLERLAAERFDGFLTADPGVHDLHAKMPPERKLIFYNTALLSQFPADYPRLSKRKYDLAVLGSLSSHRSGATDVVDAMGLLSREGLSVRALLIGEPTGEVPELLRERIEKNGLSGSVDITGHVAHEKVAATLSNARIGIVPLHDYPKFHKNIACKAFEYMACGMPTIASDLPPQHLFLDENIGIFYPCGDVEALAERIRELCVDPLRCEMMGQAARLAVERRWNGERDQRSLCEFYDRLLESPLRGAKA